MQSHYVITFIGDDRPGLVESVSSCVSAHGGNWLESKLSQLGGKFAGLVLISLPSESEQDLMLALKSLSPDRLNVRLTPTSDISSGANSANITLTIMGPDRPGIVREVSAALTSCGVNVIEMDTSVSSAPMTGEQLFNASVTARLANDALMDELEDHLDNIANEMTLELDLEHL